MKEFDKWLLQGDNLGIGCYEEQVQTWRAALKWVLNSHSETNNWGEVAADIIEELNSK